jgi:hypothetical protein
LGDQKQAACHRIRFRNAPKEAVIFIAYCSRALGAATERTARKPGSSDFTSNPSSL